MNLCKTVLMIRKDPRIPNLSRVAHLEALNRQEVTANISL